MTTGGVPAAEPANPGAVVVTGASSGIGFACAVRLAALGCKVFAGVRATEDRRLLADLPGVTPIVLDVTSARDIAAAHRTVALALPPSGGLLALV
ncbi:MAG TPA: SDR family NAD(P)-dependent oxidoreductase, partial [Gammaproteobacteria bacterium]